MANRLNGGMMGPGPKTCDMCGAEIPGRLDELPAEICWAVVTIGGTPVKGHQHTWLLCRNCGSQIHNKFSEWIGNEGNRT